MLIFYSQVKNPDSESQARFLRLKTGMGKLFNKIKKETDKIGQEKIVIKVGQNFFVVHQFTNS